MLLFRLIEKLVGLLFLCIFSFGEVNAILCNPKFVCVLKYVF